MSGRLISNDLSKIFTGIHPSWKKIIMSKNMKPHLDLCLKKLSEDLDNKGVTFENIVKNGLSTYIRPNSEHIFESFKYFDANNLRVVLIGQDPYPDPRHAHGLSFSSKHSSVPSSLRNIYKCLCANGYISSIPNTADLTNWAKQGVLMLNTMLTRTPNILKDDTGATYVSGNGGSMNNCKHTFWVKFTALFLQELHVWLDICHQDNKEIFILLWGNDAQKLEQFIDTSTTVSGNKLTVLKWGHPSTLNQINRDNDNPNAFINCGHFARVSQKYPTIVWDPNYETNEVLTDQFWEIRQKLDDDPINQPVDIKWLLDTRDPKRIYDDSTDTSENIKIREFIQSRIKKPQSTSASRIVVFTDGGCKGNGKANARASMGVYFPETWDSQKTATGTIKIGRNIPDALQKYDNKSETVISTTWAKRTNQRAELSAAVCAFETMYKKWDSWDVTNVEDVIFVTDSLQYVVSWVTKRIYKEYAQDRKFSNIPNADLVRLLCRFMWMFGRKVLQTQNKNKNKYTFEDVQTLFQTDGFLRVIHQNSHLNKQQKVGLTRSEMELVAGNECADDLCNAALAAG